MGGIFGGNTTELLRSQQQTQSRLSALQEQSYMDAAASEELNAQFAQEDAQAAIRQKRLEGDRVMSEQALAFLNGGVTLAGSPMDVMDGTRRMVAEEADALANRGARMASLYNLRGAQVRNEGRAALLGQEYNLSNQSLQYKLAENRQFGASSLGIISSLAGAASRPLFSSIFKSTFGIP